MTFQPDSAVRHWQLLQPADLRADARPEARLPLRDLVCAALSHDHRAWRKLEQLLRTLIHQKIGRIAWKTDRWWTRGELANDFFTFLLTGVRPNLREGDKPWARQGGIGHNSARRSPLAKWLEQDEPLGDYVSKTLSSLSVDVIRRGLVQERQGSTAGPDSVDRRTDADAAAIPTPPQIDQGCPQAEMQLIVADEERLYLLVVQCLTKKQAAVLTGLRNGLSPAEIALQLGVKKARVSQLKTAAVAKMRTALARLGLTEESSRK